MNFKKNLLIWIVIFGVTFLIFDQLGSSSLSKNINLSFSDFLNKIESGQIVDVTIQGHNIDGHLTDGKKFITYAPDYPGLVDTLKQYNVSITAAPLETTMGTIFKILLSSLLPLLGLGLLIFYMRQANSSTGKAMAFGKSKAKMLQEKSEKITFKDVAGIDEAKEELNELVDFLKNPAKFQALGGRIPKGCLLIGPPGTGKTLTARAVAGEANVPFFTISGSDFVEMFVGVGASRVRDMFEQGKKHAPCIIFIDEIDAVGRQRGVGLGGGNDEREQTLNQLLVEMDGFDVNDSVIIIAATNRPDVLDPALLRPGRFDRQVIVPAPDIKGRKAILAVHAKKVVLAPDADLDRLAKGTPGFTGADLANLINEAALLTARFNKKIIGNQELEEAKDKVMMGPQRKSMIMSDEEKKLTAYHEGGHALVSLHSPVAHPIYKATILPRGRALGFVMRLPESDKVSETFAQLKSDIAIAMGGRAAEELIFGQNKVTSGASSDIKQATKIARGMVREWGMSEKIGPIFYGRNSQDMYTHSDNSRSYSEDTENIIDEEVKRLVSEGYQVAKKILTTHRDQLDKIATALLEKETLTGEELQKLIFSKEEVTEKQPKKTTKPSTKKLT